MRHKTVHSTLTINDTAIKASPKQGQSRSRAVFANNTDSVDHEDEQECTVQSNTNRFKNTTTNLLPKDNKVLQFPDQ